MQMLAAPETAVAGLLCVDGLNECGLHSPAEILAASTKFLSVAIWEAKEVCGLPWASSCAY